MWFIFAVIIGIGAARQGRNGVGWFLLSAVISPLFTLILLLALPRRGQQRSPGAIQTVAPQPVSTPPVSTQPVAFRADDDDAKRKDA